MFNKKKKENEEIITNTNEESGLILGVPETLDEIESESVMDLNDIPDEELRGDIPAELLDWSGEISSGEKRISEQKKDDQNDPVLTKHSKETQSFIEYLKSNGQKSVHSEEHDEKHLNDSESDNKNKADESKAAIKETLNKDENEVNEKQEDESAIQVSKEGTDADKSEEIKETSKQPVNTMILSKSSAECTESGPEQKNTSKDKIKNIAAENTNKKEQSQEELDDTKHPCDINYMSSDSFETRTEKDVEGSENKHKIENTITDSREDSTPGILEGNRTEEILKEEGCEHQAESVAESDTNGDKVTLNTKDTETGKKDCEKEVSDDRHTEAEMSVTDIPEKKEIPKDDKVVSDVDNISDCNTEINVKTDRSDKINSEEKGKTLDLNEESKELSKDIDPMRNISVADTETGKVWRTKKKNRKKKNKRKKTVRIDKQNVTGEKTDEEASIIPEHDVKNTDEMDIQQSSVPKETLEKVKEDLKDENCEKIQDEEIKEPAEQEVVTDKENTVVDILAEKDNKNEMAISESAPEEILSDKKLIEEPNAEIIESISSDQKDTAEIKSSDPADNKNERMEDDVKLPFQNSIFRLFKKKEKESDDEEKTLNDSSTDKLIILNSEEETASHTNYGGQQLKSTEEILSSPRINTNDIKERMKKMDQTQYPRQNTEGVVNHQDYDFNDEYPENTRTEPIQQPEPEYYEEEMNQQEYPQQTQVQQPIYPRQNPQMRPPRQDRQEASQRMPQNGEESLQQPMPNYPKQNMPQNQRQAFNPQQNMPQGPHNGQPHQMNGGYPRANQNTVKRERQNTRKPIQPIPEHMPNPSQAPVQNMPQQDIPQRNPQNTQQAPQQGRPKSENYNRGERKMQGIYGGKPKPQSQQQPQNFAQPNQNVPIEDSLNRETPVNEQPRNRKSNISEQRPHVETAPKRENRPSVREKCEQQFLPPTSANQHVVNMSECDDPSKMFNNEMSRVKTIVRTVSNHDAFDEQVAYWLDHGFRIHDTKVIMPQITNQEAMLFALMIKGGSNS